MAGLIRFELMNDWVRASCLTAWLKPYKCIKKTMYFYIALIIYMAGLTRFELVNDGVKVRCLTAWLKPCKNGGREWIRTTELGESGFTVHRV